MTNSQRATPAYPGRSTHSEPSVSTMLAVVADGYGTADVLRMTHLPIPRPGPDEVLVSVHAAGLDRGTWHLMTGRPYLLRAFFGLRPPRQRVCGRDVAGTVTAVGAAVRGVNIGDEVYGIGRGTFAQYAVAKSTRVARKPANLSFAEAAVVPISGLTALQALRDIGRVQAGQQVLITGASGGVGAYAVQLAAMFGAHVTGVCSPAKADFVRSVGAERVLDYTTSHFTSDARRYDLIIDIAGNATLTQLRDALTSSGTAVLVGEDHDQITGGMMRQLRGWALSLSRRRRFVGLLSKERGSDLQVLTDLIESGHMTPHIDRSFCLGDAADAMRHLESGEAFGKIAILPSVQAGRGE